MGRNEHFPAWADSLGKSPLSEPEIGRAFRNENDRQEVTTMKVTKRQRDLLFEAYRRNTMIDEHRDDVELRKPMTQRWLGLGTESAYRPVLNTGWMEWACGKPEKRCMMWLRLTDKGLNVLRELEPEFRKKMAWLKSYTPYQESYASMYSLAGGLTSR